MPTGVEGLHKVICLGKEVWRGRTVLSTGERGSLGGEAIAGVLLQCWGFEGEEGGEDLQLAYLFPYPEST